MSEFEFFMGREDRWGDGMWALWGSLDICPLVSCIKLPYHTVGELDCISCLKVWGDVQKPHHGMAYLLVQVDDTSEARTYGLALVWVCLLQARVTLMVEALEVLPFFYLQRVKLAICPHPIIWRHQPYAPPKRQTPLCSASGEDGKPKWVDKPAQSSPASVHWAIGCVPCRVEWGWPVSHHQFVWALTHWLQCHYWQISIHWGQHSFPYSGGAGLHNSTSRQKVWHSSCCCTQNSLEAQSYSHGRGEWSTRLGYDGQLWLGIGTFCSGRGAHHTGGTHPHPQRWRYQFYHWIPPPRQVLKGQKPP